MDDSLLYGALFGIVVVVVGRLCGAKTSSLVILSLSMMTFGLLILASLNMLANNFGN